MRFHKSLAPAFLAPLALLSMAAGPCEDENIGGLTRDGAADTTSSPQPDADNTGSGGRMGSGGTGDPSGTGGRAGSGGNVGTGGNAGTGGGVGCGGATKPAVTDPCTPASATATPGRCVIGFYWNGSSCAALGGTNCTSGCDRLYGDITACQADHRSCPGGMGGSGGAPGRDGGDPVGTGGSGGGRDGSTAEAGPNMGACAPGTKQGDPCSPDRATCSLPTGGGCVCQTTWFCRL